MERVEGKSHLQWANMVIDYEGKEANLEEIYSMSVQALAARDKERADAESEPDDEDCDDDEVDQMIEEGKACKAAYKELLKAKKKKAAKAPKKKPVKRAASDSDEVSDSDSVEDETELEKPPKKKPGRKSYNLDVWEKFLHVARTSMSAPHYGRYVEMHDLDFTKPVKFKIVGGIAFKRLDWGQSEPVKYFWKKLDETDIEDYY